MRPYYYVVGSFKNALLPGYFVRDLLQRFVTQTTTAYYKTLPLRPSSSAGKIAIFRGALLLAAAGMALLSCTGCLGAFAENQARRQAARTADHYIREYAEPEVQAHAGEDPYAHGEWRQARNEVADTIVRTGNPRQQTRVGVDDRGWLTNEGY